MSEEALMDDVFALAEKLEAARTCVEVLLKLTAEQANEIDCLRYELAMTQKAEVVRIRGEAK